MKRSGQSHQYNKLGVTVMRAPLEMHSQTAKRRKPPCDLQESQGHHKCTLWFRRGLQNVVYVLILGQYRVTDGGTSSKTLNGKPTQSLCFAKVVNIRLEHSLTPLHIQFGRKIWGKRGDWLEGEFTGSVLHYYLLVLCARMRRSASLREV